MENNFTVNYDNIKNLLATTEQHIGRWFSRAEEEDSYDIKNLNYAVTCIKRLVDTQKTLTLIASMEQICKGNNDEFKSGNLEALTKSISEFVNKELDSDSDEGTFKDQI